MSSLETWLEPAVIPDGNRCNCEAGLDKHLECKHTEMTM